MSKQTSNTKQINISEKKKEEKQILQWKIRKCYHLLFKKKFGKEGKW